MDLGRGHNLRPNLPSNEDPESRFSPCARLGLGGGVGDWGKGEGTTDILHLVDFLVMSHLTPEPEHGRFGLQQLDSRAGKRSL